jgi:diacylglycerol kinase family enzyme
MDKSQDKKILFVINPKSWEMKEEQTQDNFLRFSGKYNFKYEIYYTRATDTSDDIGKKIEAYKPAIVVAAGGDGTVNMVSTQLLNKDITLGIIPAGSANGLAFNLEIPDGFEDSMNIILNGDTRKLDVIKMNESWYCYHLSDMGINARIVHRFEKEGSKGLIGYGKQMLKELFSRSDPFSFKLQANNVNKKYRAEMLVIANAKSFGTGATINPAGNPGDGKFELIIIKPYPWWILARLVLSFFLGRLDKMKYVDLIQTEKASVYLDNPQKLQNDGEILENIKKLDIKILPSALKVLVNN